MDKKINEKAFDKALCRVKSPMIFQMKAIFAGMMISLGMMAANSVSMGAGGVKVLSGVAFSIGLLLIIFLGGELFTGNVFVMTHGWLSGDVGVLHLLAVLFSSYIYNALGCIIGSELYVLALGGDKNETLVRFYTGMMEKKLSISGLRLFFLGVLCNVLVCLAVMAGIVVKNEVAKVVLIVMCIASFISCGFEHCVANMAHFTVGLMVVSGLSFGLVMKNMALVTLGNIVGGAIFVALPVFVMNFDKKEVKEPVEDDESSDFGAVEESSEAIFPESDVPANVEMPKCVKKEW